MFKKYILFASQMLLSSLLVSHMPLVASAQEDTVSIPSSTYEEVTETSTRTSSDGIASSSSNVSEVEESRSSTIESSSSIENSNWEVNQDDTLETNTGDSNSDTVEVPLEPEEVTRVGSEELESSEEKSESKEETNPPLYRLYHKGLKVHLYTLDQNEYQVLATRGWKQEGIAWVTSSKEGEPVYRLYHRGLRVHIYTIDQNEYQKLGQRGWKQEGEAFRSYGDVPIYRLYNSRLKRHLYTNDANEYKVLGQRGWRQEGTAFFGLGGGKPIQPPATPQETPVDVKGTLTLVSDKPRELTVKVTNVSSSLPIAKVKMRVWSEANGPESGKWYDLKAQEKGEYSLTVFAKDHQDSYGHYQFHLFYELEGSTESYGVNGLRVTMKAPVSKENPIHIDKNDPQKGTFDILIGGVPTTSNLKQVLVPVWSEEGGQDDLKWYTAKREASGLYRVSVQAKNHKYSQGSYKIHLYYQYVDAQKSFVASTSHKVTLQQDKPEGSLSVTNKNETKGTFDVFVSNVYAPKGIAKVEIPVWSDANGKDDIRWYQALKQPDGRYKLTVRIADHGYQTGKYHIHAYLTDRQQRRFGIGTTTTTVQYKGLQYNGSYYSIQGKYGPVIIVNKKYAVHKNYAPGENPTAKAAFDRLTNKMRSLGYGISYSYSGFRSYETQRNLYWNYVNHYGQVSADRFSARPGHSEHQIGLAFDVIGTGGGLLSQPNAVAWLANHAHEYGFIVRYQAGKEHITGYMPEAWHIRYIGKEAADIYKSGLSLEEYFGVQGGDYQR